MTFCVPVTVRGYELDTQGHLNQAVYLQYAEHARWELLRAAGLPQEKLLAEDIGPVVLETTIRFRKELRGGDEVNVTCAFTFTGRKTFQVNQEILTADGGLAAAITATGGLLDLATRTLVTDPARRLRGLARHADLLG